MGTRPTRVEQVRDALLADLLSANLRTGDQLPNEGELARRFDVSRATVREAVRGLLEVGYLSRSHGRGTFVTGMPRHGHSLDTTVSYTAMIRQAGMDPGERVLAGTERCATPTEAAQLGLTDGDPLLCVERVRTADGTPVVYSLDRIPAGLLDPHRRTIGAHSLYAFLAGAGLTVHHAVAILRPVMADARLAGLLEVGLGSPLQYIEQVDYTVTGVAVMLSSEWHVPNIFELRVHRRALASPG